VSARRRLPDLESWHRIVPADASASDLETATFGDYQAREETVFQEMRDRIERTSAGSGPPPANRYDRRSRSTDLAIRDVLAVAHRDPVRH
jgi:hypothetical protein